MKKYKKKNHRFILTLQKSKSKKSSIKYFNCIALSLLSINSLSNPVFAKPTKKDVKVKAQNNLPNKVTNLKVAIPNITILDNVEKKLKFDNLVNLLKSKIVTKGGYQLIDTKEKYTSSDLLDSDKIISIGSDNNVDVVLTGSLVKLDNDILINIRLAETVIGKIVFDKQYFIKQNEENKLVDQIVNDLENFITNLDKSNFNIYDFRSGNSQIKIRSTPSQSKIAIDGIEIGKTPLIAKNVSETQHTIESWREQEGTIKDLTITSNDQQIFQFKYNDKIYNENTVDITDLDQSETYSFEIIAKPEGNEKVKNRPKVSDVQYDLRKFKLELATDPNNMQVNIDGKVAGTTPLTINDFGNGKHTINITKRKLFVFSKIINSNADKISHVDFNLFKLGRVLISTIPSNAEIYFNNQKIGNSPKSIDLPIGSHNLSINKEGYETQTYSVNVAENKTNELNVNLSSLRNVDTNISFLPTASVDDTLGLSAFFMSLGQYSVNDTSKSISYLYGAEANYGFKNIYKLGDYFNFGAQVGAFYNKLNTFSTTRDFSSNQGVGAKLQFITQSETIPVSLAIGGFYNFNYDVQHQLNGYLTASRDFGFLSVHLGVQAQPFRLSAINLNINYNKFYRLKLGAAVLIDFGLLADRPGEYITPLFALTAGYNLF